MLISVALLAVVASACETSSLVRVSNHFDGNITVELNGDTTADVGPDETVVLSGELNESQSIRQIRVTTAANEAFELNFEDGRDGDIDIVVEGPPLDVRMDAK